VIAVSLQLEDMFEFIPHLQELGVTMSEIGDGRAEGRLALEKKHSSNPERLIAHGGVTFSLADTVGGAAVFSLYRIPVPTIDMRIDYLHPARRDLIARGEVVREGNSVAVSRVEVVDAAGTDVATAIGVYKTGGHGSDSDWITEDQGETLSDLLEGS